tara:strand:+ start:2002 stop:2412 length:411 start_codon:yes stop_codon:yes gene_type:complete
MKIGKFIAAVVVGLAVAFPAMADISPVEIKGATTVSVSKAKELFEKEVAFIDVRKNSDWDAGRIPGAVHIELKKVFSEAKLLEVVKKDKPVVFYCNGESCLRSSKASAKAVSWGFKNVYYFRLGFPGWKKSGFPVE